MTTPIEPVAPVEETIKSAPTSQAVTTPPVEGEATDKEQVQPQYVTREDMDQMAADILRRAKQSDRDRAKQIDGKLNEIKGMLDKAGTPVTPEQEAALRNQITDQIDVADEPQPDGQSAVQPTANPVDAFLKDVFTEAGANVTPNDPEWKGIQAAIDANWNNPNGLPKVLVAATKAAETKKTRTANMQETAAARTGGGQTNLIGNTPAAGSGLSMLSDAYNSKE